MVFAGGALIKSNPLEGKIALVTGGSRGIGKAISLRLAEMGASVCINYFKRRQAGEETLKLIQDNGGEGMLLRANVGNQTSLQKMFESVKETYGKLDIFISNAALGMFGGINEVDDKMWNLAMDVNAKAFLYGTQKALELMPDGGRIVALTSIGSSRYIPSYASIGASKATIECLMRYMAVEFNPRNITCNAVSGGFIDTDALRSFPIYDEILQEVMRRSHSKRLGTPEDIAAVVCFLCTPESRWVTGQVITVDGGFTLM
ncbi:MAG: enoyl-[acyl-carrier-protein] reductase FabL [candidate division Zixibacteria bacterium CG_4_9_14_3_um_filter_46_8]|nr:MAG: enoyl-[acyl-carrier-protein] reductase FabL [candidate division Zixibacteria bacterium CG_4_9_14_3_um_filter_46_8]